MIPDQYAWLAWSSAFLIPWAVLFLAYPQHRREMVWASLFTMPFGLTEPIFVPEYWSPPSLFDLALRTGFDMESLIFCFGIGGVAAVLYNVLHKRSLITVPSRERHSRQHRFHYLALASPFLAFLALFWFSWNPIYPSIVAMVIGALATIACRPDLGKTTWLGGLLFLAYYTVFLLGLELTAADYIARVWNHEALSGWHILGMPLEELLFAASFGMYWSGVYEHYTWHQATEPIACDPPVAPPPTDGAAPDRRCT